MHLVLAKECLEKTGPIGHTVRQGNNPHKSKGLFADDDVANGGQSRTIVDDPIERSVCDDLLKSKEETDADDRNDDSATLFNF